MAAKCPKCGNDKDNKVIAVEYFGGSKYHYDGVSEYYCMECKTRWGRWSGQPLADDELSTMKGHVKVGKDEVPKFDF